LLTNLQRSIEAAAPALTGVQQVFLFGSSLAEPDPHDIDLLVVYDPVAMPPGEATGLRQTLVSACAEAVIRPLDVVLLTGEEARDTDFAAREGARLIFDASLSGPAASN
jgi:predicted nucleotidyltransferase